MSWLVESYIQNKETLKLSTCPLGSECYDNIISIEMVTQQLVKDGVITDDEYNIVSLMEQGHTYSSIEKHLGIWRKTSKKLFQSACEKIAFHLGGDFTDTGHLEKMRKVNRLSASELDRAYEHINSKYSHKNRR
jgi:hypothetical protein